MDLVEKSKWPTKNSIRISKEIHRKMEKWNKNNRIQAGAELCQAQVQFKLKRKRKPGFEAVDDTV